MEYVENELIISNGRLEGEDDIIEKGEINEDSERGRFIARADRVGGAMVVVEVPPALDESGRDEPHRKTSCVLKVDDGDHGGDEAGDIDGLFVDCSRHTTLTPPPMLV